MGILSKNLVKSLSKNFRYVSRNNSCSINPSLYISRRHHIDDKNLNLLLKRLDGKHIDYFSALSTEKGKNFSPKYNLYLPFSKIDRHPKFPQFLAGSCNGLLCLDDRMGDVVLWNPSINQFKFLPPSPAQRPGYSFYSGDIFSSTCFGFDPRSKDYKVLRFFHNTLKDEEGGFDGCEPHVELYSLNRDSWKEISNLGVFPHYSEPSACVNGCYYWLAHVRYSEDFIFSIDIANEKFSTLPLPDIGRPLQGPNELDLLEFNGLLGAIVYPKLGIEKSFDFWVLNGSWTKEFTIHVSGVEKPLAFWRKNQLFFEGLNRELMVFDRATGELKNLGIYSYPRTMQLIPYVESLVSPNGKVELEEHVIRQQRDIENKVI